MPVLSMFYGVVIRMQSEKGGKHHVPIYIVYTEAMNLSCLCPEKLLREVFQRISRSLWRPGSHCMKMN